MTAEAKYSASVEIHKVEDATAETSLSTEIKN